MTIRFNGKEAQTKWNDFKMLVDEEHKLAIKIQKSSFWVDGAPVEAPYRCSYSPQIGFLNKDGKFTPYGRLHIDINEGVVTVKPFPLDRLNALFLEAVRFIQTQHQLDEDALREARRAREFDRNHHQQHTRRTGKTARKKGKLQQNNTGRSDVNTTPLQR